MNKMRTDGDMTVRIHNDLIKSKSDLSLNEIKLLRLTIMQVMKADCELLEYSISIKELCDLLKIDSSNMYKEVQDICIHLLRELVFVGDGNPRHKWQAFQWVSSCKYADGTISIKLHDDLKPYLIQLKGIFTSYEVVDILVLKTVYSVRLYELIREGMKYQKVYADKKAVVQIPLETIRKATNTEDKYPKYGMFQKRVIESAVKEINDKTSYHVQFVPVKKSRKVIAIEFTIMGKTGWLLSTGQLQKEERGETVVIDSGIK